MKKNLKTILFYGIVWGLLEFFLGGYLSYLRLPLNEVIMRTIGFSILIIYSKNNKYLPGLFVIGIIATTFKFFNTFFCTCGLIFSPTIISSMIFILLQTLITFIIFKNKSLKYNSRFL